MLDFIMQLNISARLTPQTTIIIYHYMKKLLLKKIQKYEKIRQNHILIKTKNNTSYYLHHIQFLLS